MALISCFGVSGDHEIEQRLARHRRKVQLQSGPTGRHRKPRGLFTITAPLRVLDDNIESMLNVGCRNQLFGLVEFCEQSLKLANHDPALLNAGYARRRG